MSLLNQTTKEILLFIRQNIKSKEGIVFNYRQYYLTNEDDVIQMNKFALIELLDEFQGTINQSLQAIQTLQAELNNLNDLYLQKLNAIHTTQTQTQSNDEPIKETPIPNPIYHRAKPMASVHNSNIKPQQHTPLGAMKGSKLNKSLDSKRTMENTNTTINNLKTNSSSMKSFQLLSEREPEPEKEKEKIELNPPGIISRSTTENMLVVPNTNSHSQSNTYHNESLSNTNVINMNNQQVNPLYSDDLLATEIEEDDYKIKSNMKGLQVRLDKIEKESKIKNIIHQMCKFDEYKHYFKNKYANGNYELFINQVNSNTIDFQLLEKDLQAISLEIKNNENKQLNGNRKSFPKKNSATKLSSGQPRMISNYNSQKNSANNSLLMINKTYHNGSNSNGNTINTTRKSYHRRPQSVNKQSKVQVQELNDQIHHTFKQIEEL